MIKYNDLSCREILLIAGLNSAAIITIFFLHLPVLYQTIFQSAIVILQLLEFGWIRI